jgi:hypothetical protein
MKELYNGRRVRQVEDEFPFRLRVRSRTFNEAGIGILIVGIMGALTFLLSVAYLLSR